MKTSRLPYWESALNDCIEAARYKEYKIGKHDCALFVVEVIKRISGLDLLGRLKDKYNNKAESLKFIKELGGKGLKEAVVFILGYNDISVTLATQGDLLIYKDFKKEEHLGICVGHKTVFLGESGLVFVNTLDCSYAWRI